MIGKNSHQILMKSVIITFFTFYHEIYQQGD